MLLALYISSLISQYLVAVLAWGLAMLGLDWAW